MNEVILAGWFVISFYGMDNGKHNYLLQDKRTQTNVAWLSETPLPYGQGANIKLKIRADCDKVEAPPMSPGMHGVISYYCNANEVVELKCTERNSFVIGGVRYC
jgi:hypothetical protein